MFVIGTNAWVILLFGASMAERWPLCRNGRAGAASRSSRWFGRSSRWMRCSSPVGRGLSRRACPVAAKWYLAEEGSELAQKLVETGHELIAPELLLVEVANTLFKAWMQGAIDDVHMDQSVAALPTAFSALWPVTDLVADAMVISRILQHPVYDCIYRALAWRTGASVVTADARFIEAAQAKSWDTFLVHLRDAT